MKLVQNEFNKSLYQMKTHVRPCMHVSTRHYVYI